MGVDFSVPLIICISVSRTVSKCFVWLLSAQTGEQYSAAEYTRARLAVRRVRALDPQVLLASFWMIFPLVLIYSVPCFRCSQNVRLRSRVTPRYLENGSFLTGLPQKKTWCLLLTSRLLRWKGIRTKKKKC